MILNDVYYLVACLPLDGKKYIFDKKLEFKCFDSKFSMADISLLMLYNPKFSVLTSEIEKFTCEVISRNHTDQRTPFRGGYYVSILLRLLGYQEHLIVSASNYSWNMIAGREVKSGVIFDSPKEGKWHEEKSTKAFLLPKDWRGLLLDYHPYIIKMPSRKTILSKEDAKWVAENLDKLEELRKSKAFKIASDAFTNCRFQTDRRAAIAMIWSGIEAIFGVNNEISFKLSSYCAAITCPQGPDRFDKYKKIKDLYGMRSKAVHGMKMKESDIHETVMESHELLRDLLNVCLLKKKVFGINECEEALFIG